MIGSYPTLVLTWCLTPRCLWEIFTVAYVGPCLQPNRLANHLIIKIVNDEFLNETKSVYMFQFNFRDNKIVVKVMPRYKL